MRSYVHLRVLVCAAATLAGVRALEAAPTIDHVGLECIEPGTFAVVLSGISPDADIQTAKVYFRSSLYADFYYVEMTRDEDRFVGVLPQPSPETPSVIYYVEAVDQVFESTRSAEFDPPVEDPCDDRPGLAYLPGEPGITVGAVSAGASPLPPGFSAVGIVGTITALGVSSGIGGGIGAGTAVAVAAGAAAGVTGAVVATQAEETTSTSSSTTTAIAATTSVAPPPASTTTTPGTTSAPASTTSSTTTTTIPGAPSTTSSVGPSTTSSISTTTTSVATTSVTTSVTTTVIPPLNPDCFTATPAGECRVQLNATCVHQPVDRYDWILDTNDKFKTVSIPNGQPSFTYEWDDDDCDDDSENITIRLTVFRGATSATADKTVRIEGDDLRGPELGRVSIDAELSVAGAEGHVMLNGRLARSVLPMQRVRIDANGQRGVNEVEAVLARAAGEPGVWRFEIPEAREIRILEGAVLASDSRSVTFRLSGVPGERVRFSFLIAER